MRRFAPLAALLLALAVLLAWSGSLRNGFTWDDHVYIVRNGFLRDPLGFRGEIPNAARPVWILSALWDVRVWGVRSAVGHHATSLMIHVWNAALVLGLARLLGLGRKEALLSGLVFAVHPLAAEPVCNAAFRPDLLAGLGMGAAMACALKFQASGRRGWLAGGLMAAAFALGSKETALALPLMLMAWMRPGRRLPVLALLGALVAAAVALRAPWSSYRLPFIPGQDALGPTWMLSRWGGTGPVGGVRRVLLSMGHLLLHVLWPFGPGIDPRFPALPSVQALQLSLLASALWGAWRFRGGPLGAALSWTLLAALPASNLLPLPNCAADRYAYVPLMGASIAAGLVLSRLGLPAPLLLLAVLALGARGNAASWRSDSVLWVQATRRAPWSARSWENAGVMARQYGTARRLLEHSRALAPDCPWPEAQLGALEAKQGRYRRAAEHYARASWISPRPVRWLMLDEGEALWRAGERERAVAIWKGCLRRFPGYGAVVRRLRMAEASS